MRFLWIITLLITLSDAHAQQVSLANGSMLSKLKVNDSLVYYQCRVVKASVQIQSGNTTAKTKDQQITLTEKFVIIAGTNGYSLRHYTSGLTPFPNRKFSGLKIREKSYWNFTFQKERMLSNEETLFLSQLEVTGKETTEYDFAITKYTTNQLIIKQGKQFEQKLPAKDISISEALKL